MSQIVFVGDGPFSLTVQSAYATPTSDGIEIGFKVALKGGYFSIVSAALLPTQALELLSSLARAVESQKSESPHKDSDG
jgi:hypothetical protein